MKRTLRLTAQQTSVPGLRLGDLDVLAQDGGLGTELRYTAGRSELRSITQQLRGNSLPLSQE